MPKTSPRPWRISDSHGLCIVDDDGNMVLDGDPDSSAKGWTAKRADLQFAVDCVNALFLLGHLLTMSRSSPRRSTSSLTVSTPPSACLHFLRTSTSCPTTGDNIMKTMNELFECHQSAFLLGFQVGASGRALSLIEEDEVNSRSDTSWKSGYRRGRDAYEAAKQAAEDYAADLFLLMDRQNAIDPGCSR